MQQCTMLATDDGFPWGTVMILTLLLTAILTTVIICLPKMLPRWCSRREIPVVTDECEEETEESYYASRTSHSSQEQYVQTDTEERFILLSDASTQALDWQSFSNDELQDEIAFRLSDYHFAMTSRDAIPLARCYERREIYKAWGATYNGDTKQWSIPPGRDLRGLLRYQPAWLPEPELLRREILLRIMSEVERSPFLRT